MSAEPVLPVPAGRLKVLHQAVAGSTTCWRCGRPFHPVADALDECVLPPDAPASRQMDATLADLYARGFRDGVRAGLAVAGLIQTDLLGARAPVRQAVARDWIAKARLRFLGD